MSGIMSPNRNLGPNRGQRRRGVAFVVTDNGND
jgi:hypothetical protein